MNKSKYTKADCLKDTLCHIKMVMENLETFRSVLENRKWTHDLSKLHEPELSAFTEFTPLLSGSTYGSDEYRGFLRRMRPAIEHHHSKNRHHPEYHEDGVDGMNLADVVEMFCDWLASTRRHDDGNIYRSVEINKERFVISGQLASIFKNTALDLFQENES